MRNKRNKTLKNRGVCGYTLVGSKHKIQQIDRKKQHYDRI